MYSTAFWCLFVVLLVCLALFRIHCYSSFLFTAPTTFFSFTSSPPSESLEQATRNVSLRGLCIN